MTDRPLGLAVPLASGTEILLRPIRPSDRVHLQHGMAALSPQARRQRFFSSKEDLDPASLTYLTEIDHRRHAAWVAVDLNRDGQPVVAVARYVRHDDGRDGPSAELAFVVGDDYRRQGLATMLLDLLSITAHANGIRSFSAQVLDDNHAMRALFSKVGAHFRHLEPGVVVTTFAVPAPSGRFAPAQVLALVGLAARAGAAQTQLAS